MSCSTSSDRVARAQLVQQRQHAFGFFRAHAGQRLVEQQHLGLGGQAHRDLELALLAMAQGTGRAVEQVIEATARAAASRAAAVLSGQACALGRHQAQARWCRACAERRQFSNTVNAGKMVLRW